MSAAGSEYDRARSAYRAGLTLLVAAAVYEAIARSGYFPAALLPTLPKVASTLWTLLLDGTMLRARRLHASTACCSGLALRSWSGCRSAS